MQSEWPDVLIIALGIPGSDPFREAEQLEIYATEKLEVDRRRFQAIARRAFEHLQVLQENRDLRERSTKLHQSYGGQVTSPALANAVDVSPPSRPGGGVSFSLLRFPRVFRRFDNVDLLLANVVESFADAAGVTRVGIFSRSAQDGNYRFRAGLRCLRETYELEFGERDPLVRWFERRALIISRENLIQTPEEKERALMRRALDSFGAEAIIPLFARDEILGWMFFGQRFNGQGFDDRDLEVVMMLAEHVSTVLENALLHEETTLQKTLAETLLKAIPPGIIATDQEGIVRWLNPTAEQILGFSSEYVLNHAVEAAGSRLAGMLRETLDAKEDPLIEEWTDHQTRRKISVQARRLIDAGKLLGAVAVIEDLTAEQTLRDKEALAERAAFWSDLAASMSHEIRNPLVAIKTFAQLLPERFDDKDFRKEFNQIVLREIDRLDKIITQINTFAHPPELVLKPLDVRGALQKGINMAKDQFRTDGGLLVEMSLPKDLPKVFGDETALAEAFAHLVANAAEALSGKNKPRITLSAKSLRAGKRATGVMVTVRDNGRGIAPEMKEKVFSPFCTTKPRGIGLGLPIVKRTVFDHHGRVEIDSSSHGTLVNVILPASRNGH